MTLEEYVNKRVNEEDDLKGLAKKLFYDRISHFLCVLGVRSQVN